MSAADATLSPVQPVQVSPSNQTLTGAGAWLHSPSSPLVFSVVQSDLGGDHGDCVKAICGGDDWPEPEVPAWCWEEVCLLLSSTGPQSLSLSVLCYILRFPLQTTNTELFFFFNGLKQLLKIQTSLVKTHATSSLKASTAGRLGCISSVKTVRFWCKILFRSSRIVEGIMKRLFWKSVEERINISASVLHFRNVFCFLCFVSLCSPSAVFKNTSPAVQTLLFPLCAILDSYCAFHPSLLI